MVMWHEDARFNIFTECDVYDEDSNYLLVKNIPDFSGKSLQHQSGKFDACMYYRRFDQDGNISYVQSDHVAASNGYIRELPKAPWNIARDIIAHDLDTQMEQEVAIKNVKNEAENRIKILNSAKKNIIKAKPGKVFKYMSNSAK